MTNMNGEPVYDPEDRPLQYSLKAQKIINSLIPDELSFTKLKGDQAVSKAYLGKNKLEEAM